MWATFNKLSLPEAGRKASLADAVQATRSSETLASATPAFLQDEFRQRFKRRFRARGHGFSAQENFARAFSETLHEVPVLSKQAGELYLELSDWPKVRTLRSNLLGSYLSHPTPRPIG